MLRKSRLFVGITLVVQAISFLCLSAAEGAAGTYLLYQLKEEKKKARDTDYFDEIDEFDLDDSMISDEPEMMDIPVDESATEDEFKE